MRKIGMLLVALLWVLAGVQIVRSQESGGKERVMEVLGQVGSMEQACVLDYYGILDVEVENEKAFLAEAVHGLNLTGGAYEESQEADGVHVTSLSRPEGTLKVITKTVGEAQGQYLIVKLCLSEEPEETFTRRTSLERLMREHMRACRSSVNVVGSYSGKLTLKERNQAADRLLEGMDARIVTENRGMDLYTIYGYTPYISEYQLQEGTAVNVNIAMHYNEEEDRTYIYAAVPVIGVEY